MTDPIKRSVVSPSGTTVSANGNDVVISRQPGRPNQPPLMSPDLQSFRAAVDGGEWKAARGHLEKLTARYERESTTMPPEMQRELATILGDAAKVAEHEDERSVLGWILGFLLLGIPFLVDAIVESDVEALAEETLTLRKRVGSGGGYDPMIDAGHGIMNVSGDGDISGTMNLYAGNPLLGTTSKLAASLGGPFVGMSDAVATQHYSRGSTVKPEDFEVSTGVVLIERSSRLIVSQDETGFYTMSLGGRSVFAAAGGELYFEPRGGDAPELVPADRRSEIARRALSDDAVGARARLPNDPEPRPNMRFTWHGYTSGELQIGWWGQCESSGMLGSLGLMPAANAVTLYDETRGGEVELEAGDITSMMVFMGRSNYFGLSPATFAGNVNRNESEVDSDVPYDFHKFVMGQIAAGLPFNLEAHSYEQIWNYPVREASIQPTGAKKRLPGGDFEQGYEMKLTKTNGSEVRYFYTLTYDPRGNVKSSAWDMKAGEAANGRTHAIPDAMKSYFSPSRTRVDLDRGGTYYEENRWTPEAVAIVGDLYFASHAQLADGESRVYAVRTADGRLLRMSREQFAAYREQRATGTGG